MQEVFKSDFHSVALLSDVKGQCSVLVVRDFIKFSPLASQPHSFDWNKKLVIFFD